MMRLNLLLFFLGLASVHAFMPYPDLLTVSPATAKAGSTVEVTISGKDLDEVFTLRFADGRIQVEALRQPADEFFPQGQVVPNRFKVTIPEDVPPGVYEVRSSGYFGLSTARPFLVVGKGALEVQEAGDHSTRESAKEVSLNEGVTGLLDSRKIDWYRFRAEGGQRIQIQVWAERLDSRADVMLVLFDERGRELESSRHHFGRDPFLDVSVDQEGEYFLALSDTLFRGNSQYFYRLELSTDPHLDFAFPPAGVPGEKAEFVVYGRNLPGGSRGEGLELGGKVLESMAIRLDVPDTPAIPEGIFTGLPRQGVLPGFEYRLEDSNALRIGFATAPVAEEDPDYDIQNVTVPCEIAGRFEERGDYDQYRFSARKGETLWLEVISDRMGVRADPYLLVERIGRDEKGGETSTKVAENDDPPSFYGSDALDDLNVNTLDPSLSFTVAEDGEYQVTVVNQSAGGSVGHLYRLAIRAPQPDFQLISGTELTKTINNDAYPMAPLLRRGGSLVYRILALRQDGFDGDIEVKASGLPPGVTSRPLVLSGDSREGYLVLQAASDAGAWTGPIRVTGQALIGDQPVEREARSASIIWGIRVFANQRQVRSRLDEENVLSVIDSEVEPCRIGPAEEKEWTVALKESLEIPVKVEDVGTRKGNLQIEAFGFPGLERSPPKILIKEGETEGKLVMNFSPTGNFKVKPGRFQFVLQGIGNARYERNPAAVKRTQAEWERWQELGADLAKQEKELRGSIAELEAELKQAQQRVAAAAQDDERVDLQKEVAAMTNKLEGARKEHASVEERIKKLESLTKSAEKAAKLAATAGQEKTTQFATYSLPLTVTVTDSAESK